MEGETSKMGESEERNRLTMCRLCLCENEVFYNIFEVNGWHGYVAADVISDLLQFRVTRTDGYPHVVCVHCLSKVTDLKAFKEQCFTSRLTYDNVFASSPRVDIRQDETGEFITIKAEPLDFLGSAEEETDKDVHAEVSPSAIAYQITAEDQKDQETAVINKPEVSFCDSEVPKEVNTVEVVTEQPNEPKTPESLDIRQSESEDVLDSLDEASQSAESAPSPALGGRRRRRLCLQRKLEIIRKLESGVSPAALGRAYDVNESTIRTIRKNKMKEALGKGHPCKERSRIVNYKSVNSDSIHESKIDCVRAENGRLENEDDLIENDPQMKSILLASPAPPTAPRRRKVVPLSTKMDIIRHLESGASAASVGRQFQMNESSVRTIWKMASKIRASASHCGRLDAKITRTRSPILERTERLLCKWVGMQAALGGPTTPSMVRAKALVIYERLKEGSDQGEQFMASKGWYDKFCKRTRLQLPMAERGDEGRP